MIFPVHQCVTISPDSAAGSVQCVLVGTDFDVLVSIAFGALQVQKTPASVRQVKLLIRQYRQQHFREFRNSSTSTDDPAVCDLVLISRIKALANNEPKITYIDSNCGSTDI